MNRTQTAWTVLVGGAIAVVGGLFLPWATLSAPIVGTVSVYGSEGDGAFAAGAGALAIVAGILTLNRKGGVAPRVLTVIGAAVVSLIVISDYPGIAETVSDTALGQVGTGMYALVVSAVVLVVGSVFLFRTDTGKMKTPKDADDALTARTQELMESEGIKWKQAYRLAVAELSEPTKDED